jgi:hypothetical protein
MRFARFATILALLATLPLCAVAADINGTWKAVFTGSSAALLKTPTEIVFTFAIDGKRLTGEAHMKDWPFDAPISDGQVDGNRISFTVLGHSPYTATSSKGATVGYPKLVFTGTLDGKTMTLSLTWSSVLDSGEERGGQKLDMKGAKTSE